jgi:replicative DNA helicase
MQTFYDNESELVVLSYAMRDLAALQETIDAVDPILIENFNHKSLWIAMSTYYQRYQGIIDEQGLERLMDESGATAEKKTNYHVLLSEIKVRETVKPQFLMSVDHLRLLRKKRELYDVANKITAALRTPNPDVDRLTADVATNVLNMSMKTGHIFHEQSMKTTLPARIAEYVDRETNPDKYRGVPFGIKVIDDLTSGMFPEELALVFGRSGVGKSRTLASVAYNVFARGMNVMYVTIEMPMAQVGRLFDSRHFLVSSSGLRHGKLEPADRTKYIKGDAAMASKEGDFYVVDAPAGCSALTLLPMIRKYKSGRKLDLIIIDYMNLMTPVAKTDGNEILRLGAIARELKQLARAEHVPVFTASAASRATTKVKDVSDVGTEHLSWSDQIAYQCDLIIYLRKGAETQEIDKQLEGMIVKYRDGSNFSITLGADWDKTYVGGWEEYLKMVGRISPLAATGMVPIVRDPAAERAMR